MANPNGTPGNLLAPWKKGQSGNPLGRPKGRISLTKLLAEALKDRHFQGIPNPNDKTTAECLIEALIIHTTISGSPSLFQIILDRNDGKMPDAEQPDVLSVEELGRRMQQRKTKKDFK